MGRTFAWKLLPALLISAWLAPVDAAAQSCSVNADCNDGNPCTDEICDSVLGCRYADNNNSCSDGNSCTVNDSCSAGACVGGNRAAGCSACAATAILPPEGGTFFGSTTGTTSTLSGTCAKSNNSGERVFQWQAPSSGPALIKTCSTSTTYDTVVYLRSGSCTGSQLACNDDTPGCGTTTQTYHGSVIAPTVNAGQTYWIVVDGYNGRAGNFALSVTPPTSCGNGIREGAEECDGADAASCVTGLCSSACQCIAPSSGLPDLRPAIRTPSVVFGATVPAADVAEGCATLTTGRDLLRFGVFNENVGTADLVLGDPLCPDCTQFPGAVCGVPEFECSPASGHGHPHYDNYATYDLLDASGTAIVQGQKRSFCVRDTSCTSPATPFFDCSYQGLTKGCGDLYGAQVGCQYLDVTGVPSGSYQLRVRVDPFARIPELNEGNNVTLLSVTIPQRPVSACSAPATIPPDGGVVAGTTSGASTVTLCYAATDSAPESVFLWTPSRSGRATLETCGAATEFDTVVSVQAGACGTSAPVLACNDDTIGCAVSSGAPSSSSHGSRVSVDVVAGSTYYVIVDGYGTSRGKRYGNFVLSVFLP